MPFSLHVAKQSQDASCATEWEYVGLYAKLARVQDAVSAQGRANPHLRRWLVLHLRHPAATIGRHHSMGEYPTTEENV